MPQAILFGTTHDFSRPKDFGLVLKLCMKKNVVYVKAYRQVSVAQKQITHVKKDTRDSTSYLNSQRNFILEKAAKKY